MNKEPQDKALHTTLKARTELNRIKADFTFDTVSSALLEMTKCYRKHNKLKK